MLTLEKLKQGNYIMTYPSTLPLGYMLLGLMRSLDRTVSRWYGCGGHRRRCGRGRCRRRRRGGCRRFHRGRHHFRGCCCRMMCYHILLLNTIIIILI